MKGRNWDSGVEWTALAKRNATQNREGLTLELNVREKHPMSLEGLGMRPYSVLNEGKPLRRRS